MHHTHSLAAGACMHVCVSWQVLNAVSWAKFGEKSTLDFKWNCIKEKIANVEGIEARDVSAMLRAEADIKVVERS